MKNIISESTVTVQYTTAMTEIDIDITSLTTVVPSTFKTSVMTFTEKCTTVGITTRRIITTTSKPTEINLGKNKMHILNYVCLIVSCTS